MKKTIISLATLVALSGTLFAETMNIVDTDGRSYSVEAEGNDIKISGMEGKVVFLEFFGLSCPACKQEMPTLINLQEKYRDKLEIMAVEVQNNEVAPIQNFKAMNAINYKTFSNYDIGLLVRYVAEKANWKGEIPFLVAIDSQGHVKFAQAGLIPEETLEKYIK